MRRPNEEVCTGLADEGLGSPGSESDSWGAGYSGRMNLCAYFRRVGRMPAPFGSIGLHGVATQCGMPSSTVFPSRPVRVKLRYETLMSVNLLFTS